MNPAFMQDTQYLQPVVYLDEFNVEQPPIMIAKLARNQTLDFELIAKKGTGKVHSKWSPVSTCVMWKEPIVRLDKEKLKSKLTED